MKLFKKILGVIALLLGFAVSGYGIFIFIGSIYYGAYARAHPEEFGLGDAAGLGFYYGIAIILVGLIPIAIGYLIVGKIKSGPSQKGTP